jgi:hypothetical protein
MSSFSDDEERKFKVLVSCLSFLICLWFLSIHVDFIIYIIKVICLCAMGFLRLFLIIIQHQNDPKFCNFIISYLVFVFIISYYILSN